MNEKKIRIFLPSLETLIIFIFFLGFIIWGVSKCKATRAAYQQQTALELQAAAADTSANLGVGLNSVGEALALTDRLDSLAPSPAVTASTAQPQNVMYLYVTVDSLNMRQEPKLNSRIITKLRLNEQVQFMNEITSYNMEIKFGDVVTNEPWVKIQNQNGRVGWVYGAGVHFYKKQLPPPVE